LPTSTGAGGFFIAAGGTRMKMYEFEYEINAEKELVLKVYDQMNDHDVSVIMSREQALMVADYIKEMLA
jgi:hypothetical protein